jgi:hypothetical protein
VTEGTEDCTSNLSPMEHSIYMLDFHPGMKAMPLAQINTNVRKTSNSRILFVGVKTLLNPKSFF